MTASPAEPKPRTQRLADLTAEVLAGIDRVAWDRLAAEWAGRDKQGFAPEYLKYFDLPRWLPQGARIARDLGLVGAAPIRIFDIGCGPGHLLRVCRHLGHEVQGLDIGNPMLLAMCAALDVPCRSHRIVAGEPMPADLAGFDLVTAVATKFHLCEVLEGELRWHVWDGAAWRHFLADVAGRLRPGGRFYIKLNLPEDLPEDARPLFGPARQLAANAWLFEREALVSRSSARESAS